jgi:hypothetical protein
MIMKTKNILFVIVLFFSFLLFIVNAPILTAQLLQNNFDPNEKKNIFQRVETALSPKSLQVNFYPIADGDFWEYITTDTTTLLGQFYSGLNFSISKEIVGDTLMTNGITYKKIKWENIANSVNYPQWYDYHRIDTTGNVHLFYEGSDYLLFDFSLAIGQSYFSHLPNHTWKITDRYEVIGFGDTLQAIDFELLEQGTILKEKYSFVENFGMIYYHQNIEDYSMPEGNFWGAVINGEEYGTMIATKQTVDWSEFYPLHIGDYWVYKELVFADLFATITKRVVKDTLLDDGYTYKKIKRTQDIPGSSVYYYERIDTLGQVFEYDVYNQGFTNAKHKFSITVGDTSYDYLFNYLLLNTKGNYSIRLIENIFGVEIITVPSNPFYSEELFSIGLGISYYNYEGTYGELWGASINGIVYGDTTVVISIEEENELPDNYYLSQNYPNPFNPSTTISFSIPERSFITLKVYDMLGREIAELVNEELETGYFEKTFNANSLASGVYIYRITTMKDGKILFNESKQMLLIK